MPVDHAKINTAKVEEFECHICKGKVFNDNGYVNFHCDAKSKARGYAPIVCSMSSKPFDLFILLRTKSIRRTIKKISEKKIT